MRLRALLALSVLLCSTGAVAGLKEGYAALSKKDYVTAANEYRPLAERGDRLLGAMVRRPSRPDLENGRHGDDLSRRFRSPR